jgi:predicted phosphate transport protein (TIGR00153 family)
MKIDRFFQFLVPKEGKFFPLFKEASTNLVFTSNLLLQMVNEPDQQKRNDYVAKIKDAEHEGDRITKKLFKTLNSTFITPFDREDIFNLVSKTDSIVDLTYTTAKRLLLYNIKTVPAEFIEMAGMLVKASNVINTIYDGLTDPRALSKYKELCHEISEIEGASDEINYNYLAKIFQTESDGVELIKKKDILNSLEKAIDRCDDVADVISTIIVKYA